MPLGGSVIAGARCPECGDWMTEHGCQNDLCDDLTLASGMDYHEARELAISILAEGFYVRGIMLEPNSDRAMVSVAGGIKLRSAHNWTDDARAKAKRRAPGRNRNAA
jgi:hypothetical protein